MIIGNGPAGVSAALYIQRSGMHAVMIGKDSGALGKAHLIENYYGLPQPLSGEELNRQGIEQAKRLGAKLIQDEVVGIGWQDGFLVQTKQGEYQAPVVILATGTSRNAPGIPGLKEYEGRGVSYCAVCDAFFYRKKPVTVLGEGAYALHEAMELLPIASSVTLLTNGKEPRESVPKGITVCKKEIKALTGKNTLERVEFNDGSVLPAAGLFVAMGVATSTDLARKLGVQMEQKYIRVNEHMETNVPGLFAAGDCTGGMLQIAKAVYEGARAGTEAIQYVRKKRDWSAK